MERVIQITSGRGPVECCWVVAQVLKILINEGEEKGLFLTVLNKVNGEVNRTLASVTVLIEGDNVDGFLKKWIGTIQWIGNSKFRKGHKRKNWFISVNELALTGDIIEIKESDIKFEATRAGGPGGQHVNKVSTAIRATHLGTGLTVLASDSRSQLQNKKKARERLIKLLKIHQLEQTKSKADETWKSHDELIRGNPIRVFKGSDFKSNYVDKSYKATRKSFKQNLNKFDLDD